MARDSDSLIKKYIRDKMSKKIQNLVGAATMDLYSGPYSRKDMAAHGFRGWPGYQKALEQIEEWVDDELSFPLYVDTFAGYVSEQAPEGFEEDGEWIEPNWEDYQEYGRRDALRAAFGALVTDGGLD